MWQATGKCGYVKTRKVHKCEFCGEDIQKNSEAYFTSGIYDNEFVNYYECKRCNDFINNHEECFNSIQEDGFEYGDYWYWLDFYGLDKEVENEE